MHNEKGSERGTGAPTLVGRPFERGENSHTGEVFRRGPDKIPRGDVKLLYRMILADEAETLYRQLVRGARRSPKFALLLLEKIADRIHGKARQPVMLGGTVGAIFMLDDAPTTPTDTANAHADAEDIAETAVDLAAALAPRVASLSTQSLAVLPPPLQ